MKKIKITANFYKIRIIHNLLLSIVLNLGGLFLAIYIYELTIIYFAFISLPFIIGNYALYLAIKEKEVFIDDKHIFINSFFSSDKVELTQIKRIKCFYFTVIITFYCKTKFGKFISLYPKNMPGTIVDWIFHLNEEEEKLENLIFQFKNKKSNEQY